MFRSVVVDEVTHCLKLCLNSALFKDTEGLTTFSMANMNVAFTLCFDNILMKKEFR